MQRFRSWERSRDVNQNAGSLARYRRAQADKTPSQSTVIQKTAANFIKFAFRFADLGEL